MHSDSGKCETPGPLRGAPDVPHSDCRLWDDRETTGRAIQRQRLQATALLSAISARRLWDDCETPWNMRAWDGCEAPFDQPMVVFSWNTRSERYRARWTHIDRLSPHSSVAPLRALKDVRTCEPAFGPASPAASGRTTHPCICVQRCRPEVRP
jgi:hypothetical protein